MQTFDRVRPAPILKIFLLEAVFCAVARTLSDSSWAEPALCATPEQRVLISKFYQAREGAPPPIAERALQMPELVVATGLGAKYAVVIHGEHFDAIWKSVSAWRESATFIMTKNGSLLKFRARVAPQVPNNRGDSFYDIKIADDPLAVDAHIRADLIKTVALVDLPGRGSATRAVVFFDAAGQSVFGVYASIAGNTAASALVEDFHRTWNAAASFVAYCSSAVATSPSPAAPAPNH
jgi:putative heme iron utilization protein